MTKRHAKPTSARKRKPPTAAQMVGRIPKWLAGFEERMVNQLALLRVDTDKNQRLLYTFIFDSTEAREDNLPTLPTLLRAIERVSQGSAHLRVTARTLVDHCQRLLKEKETLQRQLEQTKMLHRRQAPLTEHSNFAESFKHARIDEGEGIPISFIDSSTLNFQAARHSACAFASSHRAGIRCGVCGETGT